MDFVAYLKKKRKMIKEMLDFVFTLENMGQKQNVQKVEGDRKDIYKKIQLVA